MWLNLLPDSARRCLYNEMSTFLPRKARLKSCTFQTKSFIRESKTDYIAGRISSRQNVDRDVRHCSHRNISFANSQHPQLLPALVREAGAMVSPLVCVCDFLLQFPARTLGACLLRLAAWDQPAERRRWGLCGESRRHRPAVSGRNRRWNAV